MSDEPFDIYALLDRIRVRPGMYLGRNELGRLPLFLNGYYCALYDNQLLREGDGENAEWALGFPFLAFVARKLDGKPVGTRSYHTMILPHVGGDEVEALNLFWQLLDEFREKEATTTSFGNRLYK